MTPLLSEALQEAYASASTEDVIVDTLEVVAGTQHLYLCRGFVAITLNDENGDPHVFQPVPFEFNLPGQDSTGAQTLNVGIENVDGTVASFVQSALLSNTPIVVKYRSYLPDRMLAVPFSGGATILGDTYQTVLMPDGKEWLSENLKWTGTGLWWNSSASDDGYGRYYTRDQAWGAVATALVGSGWRIPSLAEIRAMIAAIGGATSGGKLKTVGTDYWTTPNTGATNEYSFNAKGGGLLWTTGGGWVQRGSRFFFWASDEEDTPAPNQSYAYLTNTTADILISGGSDITVFYMNLRLMRDYTPQYVPDINPQNPRPLVLTVTAAELTLKGVTFAASVADFVNQPFPNAFYSFTSFPGLR